MVVDKFNIWFSLIYVILLVYEVIMFKKNYYDKKKNHKNNYLKQENHYNFLEHLSLTSGVFINTIITLIDIFVPYSITSLIILIIGCILICLSFPLGHLRWKNDDEYWKQEFAKLDSKDKKIANLEK